MGIFRTLSDNVVEIGVMTVSIVLISLLLNSFKTSANVCPGANTTHLVYSSANDVCCLSAGACTGVNQSAINSVGTSINTSVTGVGTPITYISIIILVVVFAAILTLLIKKLRNKS